MKINLFHFIILGLLQMPLFANANALNFSVKEVEEFLNRMRNLEVLSDSKEELKVQDDLFIPIQEMSSTEESENNKEEEPGDE